MKKIVNNKQINVRTTQIQNQWIDHIKM